MATEIRSLSTIASEIRSTWKNVSVHAAPYLDAMGEGDKITDRYVVGSYESIVLGFLSNASGYRGPDAKRIKLELKGMLSK